MIRARESGQCEVNYAGFYSELQNTMQNTAASLQATQERCRRALTEVTLAQQAAEPEMAASMWSPVVDATDPPMCCPESPISYPSMRRPKAAFG